MHVHVCVGRWVVMCMWMCVEKGRGGCGVYVGAAVSMNNLLRGCKC